MELHEVTNELDLRVAILILILCVTLVIIAVKKRLGRCSREFNKEVEVVVSESDTYISIHIKQPEGESFSWEKVQEIKDRYFCNRDFIEVYPRVSEVVNNANERHLIHIKDWYCPKLHDLEKESEIQIFNYEN